MLSHQNNGIARGSGLATLADAENKSILKAKQVLIIHSKGTSRQKYPSSLMGTLALLLKAISTPNGMLKDKTRIQSLFGTNYKSIHNFFEVRDKQDIFRIHKIADEFELDYYDG